MKHRVFLLSLVMVLFAGVGRVGAQEVEIGDQLVARGAPPEFADRVAAIVAEAQSEGLPTDALRTKALEGWAKRGRVPPARVVTVLEGMTGQLRIGRDAVRGAGVDPPPGGVVAAAAQAMGRGLTADQVRDVIRATPTPEAAAEGLMVASALAAQGLDASTGVRAVTDVVKAGGASTELLELPSVVASLVARGVPLSDVAASILSGGAVPGNPGLGVPGQAGAPGVGTGVIPPGRGPPDTNNLPGKGKGRKPPS